MTLDVIQFAVSVVNFVLIVLLVRALRRARRENRELRNREPITAVAPCITHEEVTSALPDSIRYDFTRAMPVTDGPVGVAWRQIERQLDADMKRAVDDAIWEFRRTVPKGAVPTQVTYTSGLDFETKYEFRNVEPR